MHHMSILSSARGAGLFFPLLIVVVFHIFSFLVAFIGTYITLYVSLLNTLQEKLYQWVLRQQEEGSRVTTVDIVAYLQVS